MNFEEILDRDSKFESLLGEVGEKESPFEKVLGEIKPVETSLTDLKSAPKIDLQSKKFPESFLGRQMKGMEASLGLSKEEFDILETEIISQENRDSFVESVEEVTALAGQPYDIAKGASAFIMAGIPTFLLGVGGAVSEMNKELPQLFAGYSNLLDMADAAERGFNKVAEYMQPGKEKVEEFLEFPRETFKGAFGEPLSELLLGRPEDVDSDLVGEIAMVPMTVIEKPFDVMSESKGVKTFANVLKKVWLDKVFFTEDNIRGALKFAGFFAGLAALHKVYRGKPGVVKKPSERSVIKDVKEVAEKAEKIAETEMLVEKTLDGAIKSAQEKILKMEKQQLELEAKKIAEDLKKEVDVEGVVKKDLKKKGKKIEEAKSGLRTAEERQAEIGKVFEKKEVKKVSKKEKKVKPSKPKVDTGESLAKEFELRYMGEVEGLEYYGMETLKGETTLATKGVDRKALIKRMDEVKKQFEEPEPITEVEPKIVGDLPKDGVAVATKQDDIIYIGEPGEGHGMVADRYNLDMDRVEPGFITKDKDFLGATEAAEYIGKKGKVLTGEDLDPILQKNVEKAIADAKMEREPITEIDRQTGTSIPALEGEKSPFFQTKEKAEAMAKVYEGRKIVDVEVLTQKLINDVNRACHGDKSVDITKVRDELSEIATRADELNMAFDSPADFREWKATVEEAAIWARRSEPLRSIKKRSETLSPSRLNMMIPLDEIPNVVMDFITLGKAGIKKIKDKVSMRAIYRNKKIFDETGFWLGKDGKWRYEIDDSKITMKPIMHGPRNLNEVIEYKELFETIPNLKNIKVYIDEFMRSGTGMFNDAVTGPYIRVSSRGDVKSILAHEIQHAINEGAGAFKGSSIKGIKSPESFMEYRIDPGEMESRLTERRLEMTKEERRKTSPWETLDEMMVEEGLINEVKRTDPGVQLYSGIDPTKILDVIKKIRKVTPEIISEYEVPSMLKYHPETAREVKAKIAKERRVAIKEPKTFEGFGPLDGKKIEFIHHIKHKYSKTLKQAKDIADAFYEGELDAEGVRAMLSKEVEGVRLYTGIPLDKAGKLILEGASDFKRYMDDARRMKRIRPVRAAKIGYEAAIREFVDKSGNIKWDFIDKLGLKGYEIVQKLVLTKGANTIAANKLKQMSKEIYGGLTRNEKHILDNLIMAERLLDIAKYKTVKEFEWPMIKGTDIQLTPAKAISYIETFASKEGISSTQAATLRRRAKGYFEWMKKPLDDLLKAELISQTEYDDLVSHKYRRIRLIDIFDKKYESKRGRKPLTVYDSGIQELARGRKTDIYEPSSEIMALEVFNRSYGRIMRQKANKALLELAKSDPKNPFVRTKDGKGGIPSGWQRIFVFDKGERKALYISEQMSKEWLTSSSELPMAYGRALQWLSGSAVLRTFATGISWGFALRNIPRDIMHIYYAARVWEDGKWKSAYSPHLPIFLPQIGMDIARVLPDVIVRGKKTQNYFDYGGGMEFLVHQGLMLRKGKHLEPGLAKPLKLLSWFGETSELTTRVAIKEHIIRRRAKEQGLTVEEARKNKDIQREASFVARDYLDFGQGGGMVKGANNAFPYLNARVQASRGMWRTVKDNPKEFLYKVFEMGAATTLLYSAMREQAPETTKALQGSMDLQNNLCIPAGDYFGFEDEKGQMRYWGFKVPLDGGQRFFKAFFEASYDKSMGHEVDVDRVIGALKEMSPVDISAFPPTASGAIGYLWNEDLWRGEDVWRKTKKPFKYELPEWAGGSEVGGSKEEYIPGETSEFMTDVGKYTGISPERGQFVAEELVTSNSEWFYLLGKGYEKLTKDAPKEKVEQQWAEVLMRERRNRRLGKIVTGLKEAPIIGSFIFVTNPYSKYAGKIEEEEGRFAMTRFVENRELDRLTEGYLFEKAFEKGDVIKYIESFKDIDTRERLRERFDFQVAIRKLPERSFWLRLKNLAPEIRASRYYDRLQSATPEEHERLMKEESIVTKAGGFFTENFWLELRKIRREKE